MSLLSPLFRFFAPPPKGAVTAATVPRPLPYSRLSLDDWRSSGERVAYVSELFTNPLFRELVGMLAGVRVSHRGVLDPTTAAFLYGQRAGQDHVIATLMAAATPIPAPPNDLTADYGAENVQAMWENEKEEG